MKLNFHKGSNCKKVGFISGLPIDMVFLYINLAVLVEKETGSAEEQPASDRQVPHWNKSVYGRDYGLSHFCLRRPYG